MVQLAGLSQQQCCPSLGQQQRQSLKRLEQSRQLLTMLPSPQPHKVLLVCLGMQQMLKSPVPALAGFWLVPWITLCTLKMAIAFGQLFRWACCSIVLACNANMQLTNKLLLVTVTWPDNPAQHPQCMLACSMKHQQQSSMLCAALFQLHA